MIGRIHSIESFSTVDGPGIRYVVFMQGCNLRCKFCHNPDTWNTNSGTELEASELIDKILKAKVFFKNSGGGVTFSGGEPLLQSKFLIEVCRELKKHDIHISIDTAGNFDTDNKEINELMKYVDLILYDIKHIDSDEHKELVGIENNKILKMAEYLSNELNKKLWIRIVYIPDITDKNNAFERYKEYIKTLRNIEKIEILPYHDLGVYKWKELGLQYKLNDVRIPTSEECKKIEEYMNRK